MTLADTAQDLVTHVLITAIRQNDPHGHGDGHPHEPHTSTPTNGTSNVNAKVPYCESVGCRNGWKIGFAAVLFIEGLLFGYIALFLRRNACMSSRTFRRTLHYINAGGGGIFLATGLLHILPEAVELFNGEAHGKGHHEHRAVFPIPYAIGLLTFFIFLLFDRIIWVDGHAHGGGRKTVPLEQYDEEDDGEEYEEFDEERISSNIETLTSSNRISQSEPLYGFTSAPFASAGFTTIGIGIHSLFESIALGSAPRFSTALNTFIAISAHRWATSMALGSRFANADLTAGAYSLLTVLFSIIAPLGVFIGFIVEGMSTIFLGIIFAISSGTFIYIGAFETIAHEFVTHPKHLVGKFFVMVAGASLMVVVTGLLVAGNVH